MATVEEIVAEVKRFRILLVGRTGVGKTSLITRIFGVKELEERVEQFNKGEANIDKEYVSPENKYFVLHDSEGFEAGSKTTFAVAKQFIKKRRDLDIPVQERLHAIWLCTAAPPAGGRAFEYGDEELLELAHDTATPVVVIFTKYDRLVDAQKEELEEDHQGIDPKTLDIRSKENAEQVISSCVKALRSRLRVPLAQHITASIEKGYEDTLPALVETTHEIVKAGLENDAWFMWALAQRKSQSLKIAACIEKGLNHYHSALSGCAPQVGKMMLLDCLSKVHKDIITCWNFRDADGLLESKEFKQLMLFLVQDIQGQSDNIIPPDLDRVTHFVALVTAASSALAPPVAILGLTYFFVKWISDSALDNMPEVKRMMMAYTIDLISVMNSLFNFTLNPKSAGKVDWQQLKEAFEAYDRSGDKPEVHRICYDAFQRGNPMFDKASFSAKLQDVVNKFLLPDGHGMGG